LKKFLLYTLFFISISLFAQSPGGVSNGLVFWVKADDLVLNQGDNVPLWTDVSGLGNDATQINAINQPRYTRMIKNYNPGVYFNENDKYLGINNLINANSTTIDIFAIGTNEVSNNGGDFHAMVFGQGENQWSSGGYCLCTMNNSQTNFGMWTNTFFNRAETAWFGPTTMETRLLEGKYDGTTIDFYLDAQIRQQAFYNGIIGVGGNGTGTTYLGGGDRTSNSHKGHISEVIIYSDALSNNDRHKVNSYLAIKYGISNIDRFGVALNIVNSSSQSLFQGPNNNYWNGIIGIGRDDASGLNQRQSNLFSDTERIYLNTIEIDNASNTGSFSADNQFVIFGHNNDLLSALTDTGATELPPVPAAPELPVVTRIEREWKLTNTNFTDVFNLDLMLNACVDFSLIDPNDLRLLVDDDGDFTNATIYKTGDAGLSITLTGNYVNILNISNTHIANNSTVFITIASTTLQSLELVLVENNIDDIFACDADNDGFTDFPINVTATENQAIGTQSGVNSVEFFDTSYNSINFGNTYTNITPNTQTIIVRLTHNIGCYIETSFDLITVPTPTVDSQTDVIRCDSYTLSQITGSNLTGNEAYYTQANGLGISYSGGDTINFGDFTNYPITLYIYDSHTQSNVTCFDENSFDLTLELSPIIDAVSDVVECNSYTLPQITGSNLTGNEAYFTQPNGAGTSYIAGDIINLGDFANFPITVYIYDEVTQATNNCFSETSFELTLNTIPVIDTMSNVIACETYTLPQITGINLTGNEAYYMQQNGLGVSYLAGDVFNISDFSSVIFYIYDEVNTSLTACFSEISFELRFENSPEINLFDDIAICETYTLLQITGINLTGNEAYFTQQNGLGTPYLEGDVLSFNDFNNYPITLYAYDAVNTTSGDCSDETSFELTLFESPNFTILETDLDINDIGTVIVNMSDNTINYEYAIDDSDFQTNDTFTDIPEGTHTLYVRDENACVVQSIEFENKIIYSIVPSFFTPNGDGINDNWEVVDNLNTMRNIFIFDRFGKVITQIQPNSTGWNGYYNGKPIAETDYWYVIHFTIGQPVRGHFSLRK
jgi:gliding motility-associated-like protein